MAEMTLEWAFDETIEKYRKAAELGMFQRWDEVDELISTGCAGCAFWQHIGHDGENRCGYTACPVRKLCCEDSVYMTGGRVLDGTLTDSQGCQALRDTIIELKRLRDKHCARRVHKVTLTLKKPRPGAAAPYVDYLAVYDRPHAFDYVPITGCEAWFGTSEIGAKIEVTSKITPPKAKEVLTATPVEKRSHRTWWECSACRHKLCPDFNHVKADSCPYCGRKFAGEPCSLSSAGADKSDAN